jgi:hypothetical protein
MSTQLKKIPSNLWVVYVGSKSFLEISYAGKPQVVSSYILSNLRLGWFLFVLHLAKVAKVSIAIVTIA